MNIVTCERVVFGDPATKNIHDGEIKASICRTRNLRIPAIHSKN